MSDWAIQAVLIKKAGKSPAKARDLAERIVRKIEPPGRGGYPSAIKVDVPETGTYYHVRIRRPWTFSTVRTLTNPSHDSRVKAARTISKGAGLKVGKKA